ncbi:MAG: hypothetical protein QG564_1502 [Campylobacterota bacterium]|nr:hypothetical protein [Campylobacterota bacterium]
MGVFGDKFKKPDAIVIDCLTACLFIYECEGDDFEKLSEFTFRFVGGAGIREEPAPFKQDLMEVGHHAPRIAQSVSLGKKAIYKVFVAAAPILLCAAGCIEFAFLT